MPPKVKVTEEDILDAAMELTRKNGWSSITARDLANHLHCSTQPLFRSFQNMNQLKEKLFERASAEYNSYMLQGLKDDQSFKAMGIAYIRFAQSEPNLFQLLFMTNCFQVNKLSDMIEDPDMDEVISLISGFTNLNHSSSKHIYLNVWLTTHGIASMIATNSCTLNDDEIINILGVSFESNVMYYKQQEMNQKNQIQL